MLDTMNLLVAEFTSTPQWAWLFLIYKRCLDINIFPLFQKKSLFFGNELAYYRVDGLSTKKSFILSSPDGPNKRLDAQNSEKGRKVDT